MIRRTGRMARTGLRPLARHPLFSSPGKCPAGLWIGAGLAGGVISVPPAWIQ